MALNLWKIGGKPTSYNPLPTGWGNKVLLGIGDFVLKFRASSPSGSQLLINADTSTIKIDTGYSKLITLSALTQTFSIAISNPSSTNIYFYDNASKGDIIIDSIELVQKPLPKLTTPKYLWSDGKLHINKQSKRKNTAKTGLAFNGVTDYLQLPSMTMDSIEIECLIDSSNSLGAMIVDGRTGSNNQLWLGGNSGFSQLLVDGADKFLNSASIPKGQRTKIKVISNSFTDNVNIFSNYQGLGSFLKGILYKVTFYLNNAIVAQYDFENPRNLVGSQIIPNAQNLIPSFEDARWSIHANAKVLGKDVLHLDATANAQHSTVNFPVKPNAQHYLTIQSNAFTFYEVRDVNNTIILSSYNISNPVTFTTPSNATTITTGCSNFSKGAGSFDFIKPQLYQLSGKEGTINGGPQPQRKAAKRRLYRKR
jgi:hypothetical protein